ncbi:MAG TPA: NADH:flavin oxidoreductase/NADH oxidase [Magnetospirillaceae bacterium]|jgi:NADPH2 dehydrogenase
MSNAVPLFEPITLRGLTLPNRIVVAPMCQYSAVDGSPNAWHAQHLGGLAASGPGLVVIEATGVEAIGRITPGCTGIYSDANEAAFKTLLAGIRAVAPTTKIGIQIAHAGRKASVHRPWEGGHPLTETEGAWQTVSASDIPFGDWHTPRAATAEDMARIKAAFVSAAQRAQRLGFDSLEVHSAHGYLLHEFLSPLSNKRTDNYGGSFENRTRFPLEVIKAVRAVWPADKPLGMRISSTDWADGGWTIDEAVRYVAAAKAEGIDFCCASSGGLTPAQKVALGPSYQVQFAERIKRETNIPTRAVGMIVDPRQANEIVASGKADMIALARTLLDDPRWVWHAADALGVKVNVLGQYAMARTPTWLGVKQQLRPAAE